jgi:hypothetical protein
MARCRHVRHPFIIPATVEIDGASQVTSCKGISDNGFPLPTHQRTMTSFGKRTILEPPRGSLKVIR